MRLPTVFAVVATALTGGVLIYLFARPDSVFASGIVVALPLAGQLPSFLHTLAFALASAALVAPAAVTPAILGWGLLSVTGELLQHPAAPVAGALETYRNASTFDPLDLAAIVAACLLSWLLTRRHRPGLETA